MLSLSPPPVLCSASVLVCGGSVERGNSKVLGGDPKGVSFTYTNGNTVIVRDIAVCMNDMVRRLACYGVLFVDLRADVYD